MALYSDNSMKEIAYDLGFLDCAHISVNFLKQLQAAILQSLRKRNYCDSCCSLINDNFYAEN